MKPLLSQKITRCRKCIGDYLSAEEQATFDGLRDFAARQEQRRRDAQGQPKPAPDAVVTPIVRRRGQ